MKLKEILAGLALRIPVIGGPHDGNSIAIDDFRMALPYLWMAQKPLLSAVHISEREPIKPADCQYMLKMRYRLSPNGISVWAEYCFVEGSCD